MSGPRAPRNATKAFLRFEERACGPVAVKDFGSRPLWLRLGYGRPTLRREARAYTRLSGVPGVPRLVGFDGPDRLVVERVPGRPLARGHAAPASALADAERVLGDIHARGVAIADLHRSNLLVAEDGRVHVVDFAMARVSRHADRPGPLVRTLMRLDRHALARIRARHLGQPEPRLDGWLGLLYGFGRRLKRRTARQGRNARGGRRDRDPPATEAAGTRAWPRT